MKYIKLICLFLFLVLQANAADKVLNGIPARNFQGLTPIEGIGYYTLYFSESGENNNVYYVLHLLDMNLGKKGSQVIEVPATAQFTGHVKDGNNISLIFQDYAAKAINLVTVNTQSGKIISSNVYNFPQDEKKRPVGNMITKLATGGGFYFIQPTVLEIDKKNAVMGYEITRLDGQNKNKWTYSYFPEKGLEAQLIFAEAGDGMVALLQSVTKAATGAGRFEKFENSVVAVDDNNGQAIYTYKLNDGDDGGYPEVLRIEKDKSVIASGMYFAGAKFDKQNSDGLFFLKLSPKGEQTAYSKTPWKAIEDKMTVKSISGFLVSGDTKILIQDVIVNGNGQYSIIGELYKKAAGTTGAGLLLGESLGNRAFSIMDFIVFNFGSDAVLKDVYKIEKKEQSIMLPESIGLQKGLAISYLMRQYNMFSYQNVFMVKGQPYIVYTNTENDAKYIYSTQLANATNRTVAKAEATYPGPAKETQSKLDQFMGDLDKAGKILDKTFTGTDQTFSFFRNPYLGMAVADPSQVLVYQYNPKDKTVSIKTYPLK